MGLDLDSMLWILHRFVLAAEYRAASLPSWGLALRCRNGFFFASSAVQWMSGELLAMESSVETVGTGKRKVIEHTVLFELKANVGDMVRKNMVKELANLKEDCSKWVVAESAGLVLKPSQLKGASVGLFMRFFSKKDLDDYLISEQRIAMAEKFITPYTTGDITLDYEAEVDDNDEAVFRRGDAFKSGTAERIVFIKVKNGTSQEDIDTMVKALNDLNDAPELSSLLVQITAGTNFCAYDQRYSHGLVVRCPSLKVLQEYSKHPYHIGVISKTVWPIAENLLQADYIIDGSGPGDLLFEA
ncbi:hypothetical protein KC19_12G096100 [Ceratodon purpureus]|uniref:Stress-response A/B barrel domain-containing protein n=1 Tax=Ceratodon purpureus TaxID=3225 RepID=A0A8T0G5F1_CERPU|nr:hypothetical protein KC19_12G096100 [Ceratodon purpureus]